MSNKFSTLCLIQGLTYSRILKEKHEEIQDGELVTNNYRVTHVVKSDIPLDTRTVNDFRNNPDKLLEDNAQDNFDDPEVA